jgi:short-subunit dehydrogenase
MKLELEGKTVLITGASKGIGLAAAHSFAAEGCHLQLAARDGVALAAAKEEIEKIYPINVRIHPMDLAAPGAMQQLAEAAGHVDILVNNAGDIPAGPIESLDFAMVRRGFQLKVLGYMELTQIYYARMKAAGGGVIVNDIGNSGENWDANYIAGSTGNAAVMAFTRALGGVSLDDGIRVVGVNPGPVATDRMVKLMKRRALRHARRRRPLGRAVRQLPRRPPGHARRGGRADGVPGLAARGLHHGHGGDHRRRHCGTRLDHQDQQEGGRGRTGAEARGMNAVLNPSVARAAAS